MNFLPLLIHVYLDLVYLLIFIYTVLLHLHRLFSHPHLFPLSFPLLPPAFTHPNSSLHTHRITRIDHLGLSVISPPSHHPSLVLSSPLRLSISPSLFLSSFSQSSPLLVLDARCSMLCTDGLDQTLHHHLSYRIRILYSLPILSMSLSIVHCAYNLLLALVCKNLQSSVCSIARPVVYTVSIIRHPSRVFSRVVHALLSRNFLLPTYYHYRYSPCRYYYYSSHPPASTYISIILVMKNR